MKQAECAKPEHRIAWRDGRIEHDKAAKSLVERGIDPGCRCHGHSQPVHEGRDYKSARPDWQQYWWDTGSPDRDYAKRVCSICPLIRACRENRPYGAQGIWGGEYISGVQARSERGQIGRAVDKHNEGLDRHDPRRIRLSEITRIIWSMRGGAVERKRQTW